MVYVCWLLSEVFLNRFMRSAKSDQRKTDKSTLSILWIVMIVSITLGVIIRTRTYHPMMEHGRIAYAGLLLILIGMIFRFTVIRSLGRYFTVDVTIRKDHRIKKDSFYKYIRHPSYLASLISFIGFGISLNNWLSLLIIVVPVLIAFIIRINQEEKVLIRHFGAEYETYKKSTRRLIPFVY